MAFSSFAELSKPVKLPIGATQVKFWIVKPSMGNRGKMARHVMLEGFIMSHFYITFFLFEKKVTCIGNICRLCPSLFVLISGATFYERIFSAPFWIIIIFPPCQCNFPRQRNGSFWNFLPEFDAPKKCCKNKTERQRTGSSCGTVLNRFLFCHSNFALESQSAHLL